MGKLDADWARQMKHSVSLPNRVTDGRIERWIANPEGMDSQAGVACWKIPQRTIREIVDNGYIAVACEQQIDECRPHEACATCNQNMSVRA